MTSGFSKYSAAREASFQKASQASPKNSRQPKNFPSLRCGSSCLCGSSNLLLGARPCFHVGCPFPEYISNLPQSPRVASARRCRLKESGGGAHRPGWFNVWETRHAPWNGASAPESWGNLGDLHAFATCHPAFSE